MVSLHKYELPCEKGSGFRFVGICDIEIGVITAELGNFTQKCKFCGSIGQWG